MSLVDDARVLEAAFTSNTGLALQGSDPHRACRICKARGVPGDLVQPFQRKHTDTCPIPHLPSVVAALEAVDELTAFYDTLKFVGGFPGSGELCRLIEVTHDRTR